MPKDSSSLQREIRQTKPFRSPAHEAGVAVIKTADVIERMFSETLKPHGLTPAQYNVLRILRGAGGAGLCTLEVGDRLLRQSPGISRMMDRLERKQWVWRERSSEDRREVRCFLTSEGKRLVDALDEVVENADRDSTLGLTKAEQRQLIVLLDKVRGAHR